MRIESKRLKTVSKYCNLTVVAADCFSHIKNTNEARIDCLGKWGTAAPSHGEGLGAMPHWGPGAKPLVKG